MSDTIPQKLDEPTWLAAMEKGLMGTRWILLLFVAGIAITELVVVYAFLRQLFGGLLLQLVLEPNQGTPLLTVISILEYAMVAQLLHTVNFGTWHIYVSPLTGQANKFIWLKYLDSDKMKMVTMLSLAGVTSIQLLKDTADHLQWYYLSQDLAIHFTFMFSWLMIRFMTSKPKDVAQPTKPTQSA